MVTLFCTVPLINFKTSISTEQDLGNEIRLTPTPDGLAHLIDLYEKKFEATLGAPYRAFLDSERDELTQTKWALSYKADSTDTENVAHNHKDARRLIDHFMVAMHLKCPTTATPRFFFHGNTRNDKTEVTLIEKVNRWPLLRGQRLNTFSADDLGAAKQLWPKLTEIVGRADDRFNRIATATRLLWMGLREFSLEPRIVLHTASLEALAAAGNQEISYKLRLRLSRLLGADQADRKARYDKLKRVYDLRSAVAHGGDWRSKVRGNTPQEKEQHLQEILEDTDKHIREMLCRILGNNDLVRVFSGNEETLENYWRDEFMR